MPNIETWFNDVDGDRLSVQPLFNFDSIVIEMDVNSGFLPVCTFDANTAESIARKILELVAEIRRKNATTNTA